MGLLLDGSVLLPSGRRRLDLVRTLADYADLEVGIAAITAAELLRDAALAPEGVRRARRAFVDAILDWVPVLPFGAAEARELARLTADPAAPRAPAGIPRLLVAATALTAGWALLTLTPGDYEGVDGLVLAPYR